MPYGGLLLNGIKTLETRSKPILRNYEGMEIFIHLGQKTWPSEWGGEHGWHEVAHPQVISQLGNSAATSPRHIKRGMVAGVVHIGATRTAEEWAAREGWESVEQRALVPRHMMARFATEILSARWLSKGLPQTGLPGVWEASVPQACLDRHHSTLQS